MIFGIPPSEFFIGPVRISLYGLTLAVAAVFAYTVTWYIQKRYAHFHQLFQHIDRALVWMVVPAVLGARLLFVLYHPDYFFSHPSEMLAVWHGGWVWHGALAGGLVGAWLYCKSNTLSLLTFLDALAPGVALGQAIGRWGNYFNQEAYGGPTNGLWGVMIDPAHRLTGYEQFSVFHPTFLYESMLDVALFVMLSGLLLKRLDPGLRRDDKKECRDDREECGMIHGTIFFLYLILYSLGRFGIEFFRIDTVPVFAGLRAPQWISIVLIIVSGALFARLLRKQKKLVYFLK